MHDAIQRAYKTGRVEFARRDSTGKDVYVVPPDMGATPESPHHDLHANPNAVNVRPKGTSERVRVNKCGIHRPDSPPDGG